MEMDVIQLTGDLIPEIVVILLALLVLGVCVYSFIRHRDMPGVGYIIPLIYIIGMFSYFALKSPIFDTREFFEKIGYIMLLVDIAIWRIVGIIVNRSKNGTGEKPITLEETKLTLKNLLQKLFKRGS